MQIEEDSFKFGHSWFICSWQYDKAGVLICNSSVYWIRRNSQWIQILDKERITKKLNSTLFCKPKYDVYISFIVDVHINVDNSMLDWLIRMFPCSHVFWLIVRRMHKYFNRLVVRKGSAPKLIMILRSFINDAIARRNTLPVLHVKVLPQRTHKAFLLKRTNCTTSWWTLNASSVKVVVVVWTNNALIGWFVQICYSCWAREATCTISPADSAIVMTFWNQINLHSH